MIDERELVLGCQQGNNEARRQLYEAYADYLYSICFRYSGDASLAEDWMHDGILKILTQIDRFKWQGEGSLSAWIFSIQHNTIISHLRKDRVWKESLSIEEYIAKDEEPEPETTEDIPIEVLMQMIADLPTGYRAVFNLYVIEGFSHREIAQMLGIHEKSSSKQLTLARRALASRIIVWRKENL